MRCLVNQTLAWTLLLSLSLLSPQLFAGSDANQDLSVGKAAVTSVPIASSTVTGTRNARIVVEIEAIDIVERPMTQSVYGDTINVLREAIKNGKAALKFRYRYEYVDQQGTANQARASTLRSRFNWQSGAIGKLSSGFEADYVSNIGPEEYNSTVNRQTQYPAVADPDGFDLNQAYIKYARKGTTATGGRQRIIHGRQRFVGGVAWRQNEQTYDGVRGEFNPIDGLLLDYSYIWNVNRIFGPADGSQPADWHSQTHLFKAEYTLTSTRSVSGFFYDMSFDNDNGPANSISTYGVSYDGTLGPVKVTATAANQSDAGDNKTNYRASYYHLGAAIKITPVTLSIGYEVLGSDHGKVGFRTPLATLHKFQGWADKFLSTPNNGIRDFSLGVGGMAGPIKLALNWHRFEADESGVNYGDEIDASLGYDINKAVSLQLKVADYSSDTFSTDTTKVWLTMMLTL
ncbi:MAG: porin [Porticoccaceae bacterium]|jgi:hypothetical protein|nr:porin [Porticoccaceae bacterium]MBT3797687.1 porin [Porticoccaceae bacterium]MBT4164973.1 porin [Porticoccaceae bacterium]MBT4591423.1 porin [Porticoccaceae bacterium]MBT5003252.1 porin [Porticoccaceae bacterium]